MVGGDRLSGGGRGLGEDVLDCLFMFLRLPGGDSGVVEAMAVSFRHYSRGSSKQRPSRLPFFKSS